MWRSAAAVILGYLAYFLLLLAARTGLYALLGSEGSFHAASYDVTETWIVLIVASGLVAGVVGGLVCARFAPSGRVPVALAVAVLALGVIFAFPVLTPPDAGPPPARDGEVSNPDAIRYAQEPTWATLTGTVLGAVGVLAGARFRRRSEGEDEAER
jgi:hypothetical protein